MMKVRDVMTEHVLSVEPSTPLREVARLLSEHRILGSPVVDATGWVLGVVTEADLMVRAGGPDAIPHRPFHALLGESEKTQVLEQKLGAITAGGAMTSPAIVIAPDRTIAEAAAVMARYGINRLPVATGGRLVGVISRADIVRTFGRTDAQIAKTIREEVLLENMWVDPQSYEVDVHDGVATVTGVADRRSTAELMERLIKLVPGVFDVRFRVRWLLDDFEIRPVESDPVFPYSPH